MPEILGYEKAEELIKEADNIYLKFGADEKVYGIDDYEAIERIRAKAIRANLKLIECPIRHLGTEEGYKILHKTAGTFAGFRCRDQIHDYGTGYHNRGWCGKGGVVTDKEETYYADEIVSGIGREGSSWFEGICKNHGIKTQNGTVDVGVRVEVRDEIMKELNEKLYEAKTCILYTNI